jgi:hypothetical protein
MDAPTKAVLKVVRAAGISVEVEDRDTGVTVRTSDGHLHVVNARDLYAAVCLAAQATGTDLADG